jgi:hypothetical protein
MIHADESSAAASGFDRNLLAIDASPSHRTIMQAKRTPIVGHVESWHAPCFCNSSTPGRTPGFEQGLNEQAQESPKHSRVKTIIDKGESHAKD